MNLKSIMENVLKFTSSITNSQGKTLAKEGYVKEIKLKNINGTHVIYGRVLNDNRNKEYATYLKFEERSSKFIQGKCSCEVYVENSKEMRNYICKHMIASSYVFYNLAKKRGIGNREGFRKDVNNKVKVEKRKIRIKCINNKGVFNYRVEDKIIPQGRIKEFLNSIHEDEKIIFNYEAIDYNSKIIKGNIPITLTIKSNKDELILKHQVKVPNSLNFTCDVMFYDRNIYILNDNQVKGYIPLYKQLIRNREIKYVKSIEQLDILIKKMKDINLSIILDENAKEFYLKYMRPQFYFYSDNGKRFCSLKIDKYNLVKDQKREDLIYMELERYKFYKDNKEFIFKGEEEDIYNLLTIGFKRLKEIGTVEVGGNFNEVCINSTNIDATILEFNNYYKINYNVGDFTLKELGKAIMAMKSGARFYRKENSYLDLEDPGVVRFLNLLDDLGMEDKIEKNKVLYLADKLNNSNLHFIKGGEALDEIVNKLLNKEFKRKLIPKALNAKLRNYQITGFKWLNEITHLGFGAVLADDMGLGKTIQIIAFILSQKKSKTLIITPTSLIYNWKNEFDKFAPTIKVALVHGDKSKREKTIGEFGKYDVLLTSYGSLKNDEVKYLDKNFDYCIIDEAQNIKNSKTQISLSVKKIKSKCNIALSGTPIENNLMELWSIFDFVMPGYLFTKERFKERFGNGSNIDELKTLITPFILRRLKSEVLDELPPKIEKKYFVEMNSKQRTIYKSYLKEVKTKIDNSNNKITLFSYLTKLRQLSLDPSLVIEDYVGESSKVKVVLELINNITCSGKKVLLFSQFTSVLHKIEGELKKNKIEYFYLDGSTKAEDRLNKVKTFNEDNNTKVFLISLKAGGVGLNLTSASVVIHFDPWWNPSVEDQATDRAYRIGQKNMVEVIKLVAKDTIEEKIVLMQEDKKELIESLMDGKSMDGNGFKRLTNEEIIELFN